nr:MAG TPA: hypothetical protein [Caudoviricetes sp.]
MTVKELIKQLQEFDENLQIWFDFRANVCSVELSENYDGDNVVVLW